VEVDEEAEEDAEVGETEEEDVEVVWNRVGNC